MDYIDANHFIPNSNNLHFPDSEVRLFASVIEKNIVNTLSVSYYEFSSKRVPSDVLVLYGNALL